MWAFFCQRKCMWTVQVLQRAAGSGKMLHTCKARKLWLLDIKSLTPWLQYVVLL